MSRIPAATNQSRNPATAPVTRTPSALPTPPSTTRGTYGTIQHINGGIVYSDPRDNPNFAGNQISPITQTRPTTTIRSDQVGSVTQTPIAPSPTPNTSGLTSVNNANSSQVTSDSTYAPPENTTTPMTKTDIQSQIGDYIKKLTGQSADIAQIKTDAGLEEKKQRALTLSNEIDQFDKDFRDKVKRIRETPGGTTAGVEATVAKEQAQYEDTRANKYLSYRIANQDYQGADEIVTEKVNALKDQNAQLLQAYQLQASYVYNDLTESEKLSVQNNYQTIRDTHQAVLSAYTDVLKEAASNGAPASILAAIDAAAKNPNASPASIYKSAGTYLSAGGQGADAPLYAGLNSATSTAIRAQVGAFKTEPIVTNFSQIQSGYNFAKNLSDTTNNPADDQALIYSLAKTLDPGSVVREGEYATAQKYSQSWIKAYGKGVEQALAGTGFLSETARKNIKETIKTKYNSALSDYRNLSNSYVQGINSLTGRSDGESFIRNYAMDSLSDKATPVMSNGVDLTRFDLGGNQSSGNQPAAPSSTPIAPSPTPPTSTPPSNARRPYAPFSRLSYQTPRFNFFR